MAFGFLRRRDKRTVPTAKGKPAEAPTQESAAVVRWCEEDVKEGSSVSRRFLDLVDAGWTVPSSDKEARE